MIKLSKNSCVGCGICEVECPVGAISMDVEKGFVIIDEEKCINCGKCVLSCPQQALKDFNTNLVFALGTDDQETIKPNDHFGMSKFFQIWVYNSETDRIEFKENRENVKYKEDETRVHGDVGKAKATSSVLGGVDILVGKRMGPNITRLKQKFVPIIVREPSIDNVIIILQENMVDILNEKEKVEKKGLILT